MSLRLALLGADSLSVDLSPNPVPGDDGLSPPGGAVHESAPTERYEPEHSAHEFKNKEKDKGLQKIVQKDFSIFLIVFI